jgi:hypothetical protein
MHEWIPVVCGVMLGVPYHRGVLSRTALLVSVLIIAFAASTASGEFARSPLWILSDLALVSAGVLTVRMPAMLRVLRRRRQPQRAYGRG